MGSEMCIRDSSRGAFSIRIWTDGLENRGLFRGGLRIAIWEPFWSHFGAFSTQIWTDFRASFKEFFRKRLLTIGTKVPTNTPREAQTRRAKFFQLEPPGERAQRASKGPKRYYWLAVWMLVLLLLLLPGCSSWCCQSRSCRSCCSRYSCFACCASRSRSERASRSMIARFLKTPKSAVLSCRR